MPGRRARFASRAAAARARKIRALRARKSSRRAKIARLPLSRGLANQHKFIRWETTDREVALNTVGGTQTLGMTFALNLLANYSELTTLYDQYRIDYVKLYFSWSPSALVTQWATPLYPTAMYRTDFDDTAGVSELDLKQSPKTRYMRINPNAIQKFGFKPSVLVQLFESGVSTAYAPKWKQRIDCTDSSTEHYGIKMIFNHVPNVDQGVVTVRAKYWLTMFNPR